MRVVTGEQPLGAMWWEWKVGGGNQWVSPGSTARKGRKDRCWLKQEVQSTDYLLKRRDVNQNGC